MIYLKGWTPWIKYLPGEELILNLILFREILCLLGTFGDKWRGSNFVTWCLSVDIEIIFQRLESKETVRKDLNFIGNLSNRYWLS